MIGATLALAGFWRNRIAESIAKDWHSTPRRRSSGSAQLSEACYSCPVCRHEVRQRFQYWLKHEQRHQRSIDSYELAA